MGGCITKRTNSNSESEEVDTLHFSNSNTGWKDTIPFVPPVKECVCIKVYDGDTITVASKMPWSDSPMYRFSVRLNGIDTPEIKGKDEAEKRIAVKARDALAEIILNKPLTLKNVTTEKYGRLLADVHHNNIHLNKWMVEQRYAVEYDGGTKKSPDDWEEFHNSH